MADVNDLLKRLEQGVKDVVHSDVFRQYLLTIGKFHHYSWGNCILIAFQKPIATYVAGFLKWKELGRWVKKGEHGIAILAPCLPSKQKELEERIKKLALEIHRDPTLNEIESLKRQVDEEIRDPVYYKVVYVYDISQTEGKPLPEVKVPTLSSEPPPDLFTKLERYRMQMGIGLVRGPMDEMGYYNIGKREIGLKSDIPYGQLVKTLAHELAHATATKRVGYSKGEILAESVSFVVCGHFGFDTGARSFPYVAIWSKDLKQLYNNLAEIKEIASEMIEKIAVL